MGIGDDFTWGTGAVNVSDRVADHSFPSNVEFKNEWSFTFTFPSAVFEETLMDMSNELPRGRRFCCSRYLAGCVQENFRILYKGKNS